MVSRIRHLSAGFGAQGCRGGQPVQLGHIEPCRAGGARGLHHRATQLLQGHQTRLLRVRKRFHARGYPGGGEATVVQEGDGHSHQTVQRRLLQVPAQVRLRRHDVRKAQHPRVSSRLHRRQNTKNGRSKTLYEPKTEGNTVLPEIRGMC